MSKKMMQVTEFAKRHWKQDFGGTKVTKYSVEEFEEILRKITGKPDQEWYNFFIGSIAGYAPFCKLFIFKNFAEVKTGALPITLENYQYLRSGYHSRTESELPVLSRWFELPLPAPVANYIVLVCYTQEQLKKENKEEILESEWGIVAILGQMGKEEEPMNPATMIRNALGMSEGGSGVPLDRAKYLESVEFWKNNATVK